MKKIIVVSMDLWTYTQKHSINLFFAAVEFFASVILGHLLELLSMVNVEDNAPIATLVFQVTATSLMICFSDSISSLLSVFGFTQWLGLGLAFLSLVVLKVKKYRYGDESVFRVPIFLPIIMTLVSLYLTLVPIITKPTLTHLYVVLYLVGGLIFYVLFVHLKVRVRWYETFSRNFQIIFRVAPPEKYSEEH